jgi:hypothetical protein
MQENRITRRIPAVFDQGRTERYLVGGVKAHTDRTRFGNATRIFSFQKQIKPSTDKNFTRYADQIAKIASVVPNI